MNTTAPPLYRLLDRRQDGTRRVIAEVAEPADAAAQQELLIAAGATVDVEIIDADDVERNIASA